MLRLHSMARDSMARTVINSAPMDVATDEETLPELAQGLILELHGAIARLRAWVQRIEPMEAMAARD